MTSRSRPGSRTVAAALVAAALAGAARAEDAAPPPAEPPGVIQAPTATLDLPPPILVIDQERLFADSAYGKRVQAEIESRSRSLAAENRRIEAGLVAEEQELTDLRASLPADEFRKRADAFDAKVQRIRAEQEAKSDELGKFRDAEQQRFFAGLGTVLSDIAHQRGALAVMDRRAMLVSAEAIDITAAAIAAMDARYGDGTSAGPPKQ